MAPSHKHDEDIYSFTKVRDHENYDAWATNMAGALMAADLWVYIDDPDSRPLPPVLAAKDDDDEERQEIVYQRLERRNKAIGYRNSCIGKIYRMCSANVQKVLDSKREGGTFAKDAKWTPKEVWDEIKKICSVEGWGIQWGLMNRFVEDPGLKSDTEEEANRLEARCLDLIRRMESQKMTIEGMVTLMVLNSLPPQFAMLRAIKSDQAKHSDSIPSLHSIIEDVKDNIRGRKQENNVVNYAGKPSNNSGGGGGGGKIKGKGKSNINGHTPVCGWKDCKNPTGHWEKYCFVKFGKEAALKQMQKDKDEKQKKDDEKKSSDKPDSKLKNSWDVNLLSTVNSTAMPLASSIQNIVSGTANGTPAPSSLGDLDLEQVSQMVKELQIVLQNKVSVNKVSRIAPVWHTIIDSGAMRSVFSNRELIHDYVPAEDYIQTASNEVLRSPGYGTVLIDLEGPDGTKQWRHQNVMWCPDLGQNLLGTIPLNQNGIEVRLKPTGQASELVYHNECFGYADIMKSQYVVRGQCKQADLVKACVMVTPERWHNRMAHLGWESVLQLPNHAKGVVLQGKRPECVCGPCMKGHQRVNMGHMPMKRAEKPLQFIHSDLAGPFPPTREGYLYYMTFTDDFTGTIWIRLLKRKSEAFEAFKEVKAAIEKQAKIAGKDYVIAFLRTDRGGEYITEAFQQYLRDEGIKWEPSAAYTHNQNGKAERANYTIMSSVRAMRAYARLPLALWGQLCLTSVHLRNRSPHKSKPSSYENLTEEQPDLSHMRTIGSRVWVHIPKEKRKKVEERSWQGILVGYEGTNYKIYDPTNGKVTVHKSVIIDESAFYDKAQNTHDLPLVDEEYQDDIDELADPDEGEDDPHGSSDYPPAPARGLPSPPSLPTPAATPPPTNPGAVYGGPTGSGSSGSHPPDASGSDDEGETHESPDTPISRMNQRVRDLAREGNESLQRQFTPPITDDHGDDTDVLPPTVDTRRRSKRNRSPIKHGTLDSFGNERYDPSKAIPKVDTPWKPHAANYTQVNYTGVADKSTPGSHRHMVKILAMLASDIDNAGDDEPITLRQAMASPFWPKWLAAMKVEASHLKENKVWDLVDHPEDREVLTGRWVFKLKKDRLGNILKYKARWVVHGYKQRYGIDYDETFASVAKPMSWKSLLAMSILNGMKVHQMDVVTAFLYGLLDIAIYVEQPHELTDGTIRVCLLRKSLYGLKQSPRVWFKTLTDFLIKSGLKQSKHDEAIFMSEDKKVFVSVYVDDLLLFSADDARINALKEQLSRQFKMTDLGGISHYLGMEVDITDEAITLRQSSYLKKVLNRFQMGNCRPVYTPMEPDFAGRCVPSDEEVTKDIKEWYQSAIGSLLWPAMYTRPEILYAVGLLSKYNSNPGPQHIEAVRRILKYLAGSLDVGIRYSKDGSSEMVAYSDSDYAGAIDGRKSTAGYVFMLAGGPISHNSKRQSIVALSSCEAEYIGLTETGKEAIWLSRLLTELGQRTAGMPIALKGDNQGANALTMNPEHHRRTKHIDVRHHWIREAVQSDLFKITYVNTKEMIADGFTKPLPLPAFRSFIHMLGMTSGSH